MRGKDDYQNMDETYSNREIIYLNPIQEALDKHVLKRLAKDANGNVVVGEAGDPVRIGMTLANAVAHYNRGKKISNLDMLDMGYIPVSDLSAHRLESKIVAAEVKQNDKRSKERLAQERVAVFKTNGERTSATLIGIYTKGKARSPFLQGRLLSMKGLVIDGYPFAGGRLALSLVSGISV